MKTKYLLTQWPESQLFIGVKGCYCCQVDDEDEDFYLDQVMFVPEDIYYKIMNNHEHSNTRTSYQRKGNYTNF